MIVSLIYFVVFFAIIFGVVKFAGEMSDNTNRKEDSLEDKPNTDNIFKTDKKLDNIFKENTNPINKKS